MRNKTDLRSAEEAVSGRPVPTCIRCGEIVQGSKYLYTICKACLDKDYIRLTELYNSIVNGADNKKGERDGDGDRPAGDSGPSAGISPDTVPF